MQAKSVVVIPAYNEEKTIGYVVDTVLEQVDTVIVVNDASIDTTAAVLKTKPVFTVNHSNNMGKGAALTSGFKKAFELGADSIITMDGDAQHNADDLDRFIETADKYRNEIIIGSRQLNQKEAPRIRLLANRFADFWIAWAAGQAISDSQCGFRLYPSSIVKGLNLTASKNRGFVFESEILIEASRGGCGIIFIPIKSCYPENRRKSHFRPVADIVRITLMVAKKLVVWGFYPKGLLKSLSSSPIVVDC